MLSRIQLRRFLFLTEQKSQEHLASHCTWMLLQHLKDLSSMQFQFTQDVMDLVLKIQHLLRSLLYTTTMRKLNSQSVSKMMLHICHWKLTSHSLQLRKEQSTVSSGDLEQMVLLEQTRTPSRSLVITQTCMHRLTLIMTLRSPVVLQCLTFALVRNRLSQHT